MRRSKPTEAVLAETRDLDSRSVDEILALIHAQDGRAWQAVGRVLPAIAEGVDALTEVLANGGCWYNVGAGTSGRMGALDAAEIPPTFGLDPRRVRAILAGGESALIRAVEDAEDDGEAARTKLMTAGLRDGDAVLAISASGDTPFALSAIEFARESGARHLAITCDPESPLAEGAEIAICPTVGPEVIAGSTRMKGGLAQKMVLHLLSTTVMVKLGYVSGNLMTNLTPNSRKLRERGLRIVMEVLGLDELRARELLDASGGVAARAIERGQLG
ncbi:N-acetylmuramic acid 6-phosphate etherase [Myxococcota bacterium]|nr:N-acetylmuramic acid 6-phosphate etherase [Myxococcota bacterium]